MDTVNVQQEGDDRLSSNRYIIVPRSNFSCNGRITGYMVSLRQEAENLYDDGQLDCGLTYILVWQPLNTEKTMYRIRDSYTLGINSINNMGSYYFVNEVFSGSDRIEFQSGDVIGYRHRSSACYRVWSDATTGYTSYTDSSITDETINIGDGSATAIANRQPLIQVSFGMTYLQPYYTYVLQC